MEVSSIPANGHQLQDAPKELSVTYRQASHKDRPDPPTIHYVVATTCPAHLELQQSRIAKYSWIKVCCLEDLVAAGIIPEERKDEILSKQAANAK